MKQLTLVTVILLSLFTMGCDETKKVLDTAGSVQLSGMYTVDAIKGANTGVTNINLSFAALDKSIRGNTGCNSFFGKYNNDLYALSFSDIAATEMACDEPIHSREQNFLEVLRNTGSYTYEKGVLTLYSKIDRSELLTATKETTDGN